ncbi:MAG: UbiA family prenyltransferase, partial [Beijerinckiaceae bacterium]
MTLATDGSLPLMRTTGAASDAAPAGELRLEGGLILSDLRIEALLLTLRDNPRRIGEVLSGASSADGTLPFDPAALRYDWPMVEALRRRRSAGEPVAVSSDLPAAWREAILSHLGLAGAGAGAAVPEAAEAGAAGLGAWLKALRLHQWAKNALVFVPLVMAHRIFDLQAVANTVLAFICFGMVASSIYLMNDLMDLRQDRRHPTKRRRPFASGALPVRHGLVALPTLIGGGALIAAQLPPMFWLAIAVYLVLNLGYTFYLTRKLLVDVIELSGAYTLRILAGNAAGP